MGFVDGFFSVWKLKILCQVLLKNVLVVSVDPEPMGLFEVLSFLIGMNQKGTLDAPPPPHWILASQFWNPLTPNTHRQS